MRWSVFGFSRRKSWLAWMPRCTAKRRTRWRSSMGEQHKKRTPQFGLFDGVTPFSHGYHFDRAERNETGARQMGIEFLVAMISFASLGLAWAVLPEAIKLGSR